MSDAEDSVPVEFTLSRAMLWHIVPRQSLWHGECAERIRVAIIDMLGKERLHENHVANLLRMSESERVDYFVRYCADSEEVWGLVVGEDNWVIFKDHEGDEIFPVWPHQHLAVVCCFEEHRQIGATPQAIPLEGFLVEVVPDMGAEGVLFGVFYGKDRKGMAVPALTLKAALEEEIAAVWE